MVGVLLDVVWWKREKKRTVWSCRFFFSNGTHVQYGQEVSTSHTAWYF
jgi:hypothetical protein